MRELLTSAGRLYVQHVSVSLPGFQEASQAGFAVDAGSVWACVSLLRPG